MREGHEGESNVGAKGKKLTLGELEIVTIKLHNMAKEQVCILIDSNEYCLYKASMDLTCEVNVSHG